MTLNVSDWVHNTELSQDREELFSRAIHSYRANSNLVTEHANHEESIRVGGYANRTLLELVQNAADAMSGADELEEGAGQVEIVLDLKSETLYCANGGRPFSRNGLISIAHAHLSGKRGDEIGRFGLGFKSVLSVTDSPQVFSRSISFEFNSPQAKTAIAMEAPGAKRLPILRTPTPIDVEEEFAEDLVLAELAEWATTIVRLPHVSKSQNLKKEIEEFRSEFLLFVTAVREIRLRVIGTDEDFATSHVSREIGIGAFRIERPNGDHDEWHVENRMHETTPEARAEVGEAVSRDRVKVTVAMPARLGQMRTGEFWSYFPLQDTTSASALFNAPWSVNDDRTTLLQNSYNREILTTLARMFVDILPKASSVNDRAAHLEYMPARGRGREIQSFGDEVLCAHVPYLGSQVALVPDSTGILRLPEELRPLDFSVDGISETHHMDWTKSPNTGDDVPHWRCYANNQRAARLRQLFAYRSSSGTIDLRPKDEEKALENLPRRGVLSWLREWAEGPDLNSAAKALDFALLNPRLEGIRSAKVIPTSSGMRSLGENVSVFLKRLDDIDIEGASFIDSDFLAIPGVEKKLRERAGFSDLDPLAILKARLAKLSTWSDEDAHSKFWDAVLDVPIAQARIVVDRDTAGTIKAPTCDGGWSLPMQVFDIEGLGDSMRDRRLDRSRCVPEVAYAAGVIHAPLASYSVEDEVSFADYSLYVREELNRNLGPGERPIERIEFDKSEGPGPFSVLLMLQSSQAPDHTREMWTLQLLGFDDGAKWTCEDIDTGRAHQVASPVRWAVERAGLLNSTRGYGSPAEVVSASLVEYEALLPLFRGPRQVEDVLALPKDLDAIPVGVVSNALESEPSPSKINDSTLTVFVLDASQIAYPDGHPPLIPARVGRGIEVRRPNSVYLATTDEERIFLASRHKPYLQAHQDQVELLVQVVGCRRFEDSFSFSMVVEGQHDAQPVIDLYTGLRSTFVVGKVMNAAVSKAVNIVKRVTTEDGVEDQSLPWHMDGVTLVVRADLDERGLLEIVNEAFDLRLNNAELSEVLQTGVDQWLEEQRQGSRAASTDAERLEVFFGDDTLREILPKGLWQALEGQGLVDGSTSVAELFLIVYGSDSIRLLADQFRNEGYLDVPTAWAGGGQTISWLRKMGFAADYAGRRNQRQNEEFVVPGAVKLNRLHDFQAQISQQLREVLTVQSPDGRALKCMVELPTGAGKTRVATETVLRLFIEGCLSGTVLWIAQSEELCEQAVQTFSTVWRGLSDERPMTIGRLWGGNSVHEPDTEFSVVVATDAKLYDSVVDSPTYEWLSRASAVFIDEAHRAGGSPRYTRILKWLGVDGRRWERPLVGLSATPFKGRADDSQPTKELATRFGHHKLTAFEDNAYEELSRIGVLSRVKHEVLTGIDVELKPSELAQIRSMRKLEPQVLDRIGRDQARMRVLISHIMKQDPEWPILVFTPSVLSAQVLAATLRYRNIEAAAVSGQTGRQQRRDVIESFKQKKIQVLANCDLLIQGFDAPGVRALYIARPTFSPSAYIQMAGRGLRGPENGGSDECLIVDVADNFGAVTDFLGYREYEKLWGEQQT
ncbi:DEAD/DEAH box helicase [Rhodococcus globerulus]|uniref:DEAD/DEAH box helicase n=1 Tax=Rhodococcus globerulus TaxID=33008 RepID=UPI000A5C5E40|nr:DEAD/DEAH box helicase family protein [Rhodococcus globerulus]